MCLRNWIIKNVILVEDKTLVILFKWFVIHELFNGDLAFFTVNFYYEIILENTFRVRLRFEKV